MLPVLPPGQKRKFHHQQIHPFWSLLRIVVRTVQRWHIQRHLLLLQTRPMGSSPILRCHVLLHLPLQILPHLHPFSIENAPHHGQILHNNLTFLQHLLWRLFINGSFCIRIPRRLFHYYTILHGKLRHIFNIRLLYRIISTYCLYGCAINQKTVLEFRIKC